MAERPMLDQRNGGKSIDTSRLQFVPDFGIERPPKHSRSGAILARLAWFALGMAVTATIILAAGRP